MQKLKCFSVVLLSVLLTSCGPGSNKIALPYKIKNISAPLVLTSEDALLALISNADDNNLLLVSYADDNCSCWSYFDAEVLRPFVTEKELPVYVIETKYLNDYHGLLINETQTNTPVFGIYEAGIYKYGATYNSNVSLFRELSTFKNYVSKLVSYPTMYKA